jgi:hypothetical protein
MYAIMTPAQSRGIEFDAHGHSFEANYGVMLAMASRARRHQKRLK